jgi:hypothetical protein
MVRFQLSVAIFLLIAIACDGIVEFDEKMVGSPDLVGVLPPVFLSGYDWFSSHAARKCLGNKRLVFLGDSTMTEMTDDFAILLSGIGGDRHALDEYVHRSTHVFRNNQAPTTLPLPNGTIVTYYNFHRNMTVNQSQDNIFIRHRFMGHYDIFDDNGGVETFTRAEIREELDCILGADATGCPKPDVVILNSGLHDKSTLVDYAFMLNDVITKLKNLQIETILWRGNLVSWHTASLLPDLLLFDRIAKELCKKHDIPVMDGLALFNSLEGLFPNSMEQFTKDYIHYGSIARFAQFNLRMTLSSMMTQETMRHLCPNVTTLSDTSNYHRKNRHYRTKRQLHQ